MTTQPGAAAKMSAIELAVLLALCLLAGVGAGLAFASAAIGLAVAIFGLLAVMAYAAAANLHRWPRRRRKVAQRLSVSDISARRRGAPGQKEMAQAEMGQGDMPREERAPATAPEQESNPAPDIAPNVAKTANPDRVVPFRMPSLR